MLTPRVLVDELSDSVFIEAPGGKLGKILAAACYAFLAMMKGGPFQGRSNF